MFLHFVCAARQRPPPPAWSNKAIVLAAGLLWAAASQAQTIGNALEQAWSRQPQAVAFAARESEAQARVDVAAGLTPGPGSMSLANLSDRLNANSGANEWELEVAVPLWLPGQRAARGLEAGRALADVSARRTALRLQMAGEIREAWWALALARQALDLADQRETAARALEIDVMRRFKVGELARTDANLAHNERLAAEGEQLMLRAALRQVAENYRLLTGLEAPEQLPEEQAEPARVMDAMHPLTVAAQAAAELARTRLGVAQQTRRDAPELAVRVVRDRGDLYAPYANRLGIKLTIPFSAGARVRQDTSAAEVEVSLAEAELALAQQRVELNSARARLDLEVAQQQLSKAQERLALTADNLGLAEKSFALGESDLPALLRARLAAFEAQAFFNRQQTARMAGVSRLNQSLGVMP